MLLHAECDDAVFYAEAALVAANLINNSAEELDSVHLRPSSSKASKTDWKRVRATKDKDIKFTPEHPELDVRHLVRGIVRRGLKPVPPKASIALRVDADVLEWFKAQGPGYQTRINAVLRAFRDASL